MTNINVRVMRVSSFLIVNYCYLVIDNETKYAVLVDPAWEKKTIESALQQENAKLAGILITHHHPDHVHLAEYFAKNYDVSVYMSKIEIEYYGFKCKNLVPIENFDTQFQIESISITPYLTPGHTAGGTSYQIGNNLFTGDTLFIEGCGLCTGRGGSAELMFDTLQMLKSIISREIYIYPGHSYGEPVGKTFGFLLENNVYLMIDNKEDFVNFRMRPNQRNLFRFK